ncbi:hypothetical protein LguiA_009314 [Lonicera macranthoides]
MAGKHFSGDAMTMNLAGMSKSQLYDIMSQMKAMVEQNHQQARDILVQNPGLTKGLFQNSNIQPDASQGQPPQQSNIQASPSLPVQTGLVDQTNMPQVPNTIRKQQENQTMMQVPPTSTAPLNVQSQSLPSYPSHVNAQAPPISLQQSQNPNMPPLHSASQPPSPLQPPMATSSTHLQQPPPPQTTGIQHLPPQPPLPQQPRPPSMPAFPHQLYPQMGQNANFQHSGGPHMHHSQPMFHVRWESEPGARPPPNMGPSFSQGQPPLSSLLPPQSLYQVPLPFLMLDLAFEMHCITLLFIEDYFLEGPPYVWGGGSHSGMEFGQAGSSMQGERGSGWMPGLQENTTGGTQFPGPPPALAPPGQMGPGNQAPRPPPLTPDMEQALLQQVMSLTAEQINLLPPEQRNQVLQLQQIMRK